MLKTASTQRLLNHQHVLLLQGKMGSFFNKFASFLKNKNIQVSKINFNAGDKFFYNHDNSYDYVDNAENFKDWLHSFVKKNNIDAIVCFADCRTHHMQASQLCNELNISFFVFEEGYLRPDYITFEQYGINGYSKFDTTEMPIEAKKYKKPIFTYNKFYKLCYIAFLYYFITWIYKHKYPNYSHYRGVSEWQEVGKWLKAPLNKAVFYVPDKILLAKHLLNELDNQYFLVCLQVHNDTQIIHHSDYDDVKDFIIDVMTSFANNADNKHSLVIKHHPLDRGHRDYRLFVKNLAKTLNIKNRVYYGCDMHLPTIIKHSLGMVVVNSTTGLQSIYHRKPTKIMGRALYDLSGLTDQKPLDEFWQNPEKPDRDFYLRFREHLINENQLNGSFFGGSPWMENY